MKREKAIALLRGFPKKRVLEIQKKLSDQETCLGVLSEVQGLLRAVGEKEAMQESEKSDDSLDGLDLSGRFQQQFSPVKPPTPDGPDPFVLQAMKEAHCKSLTEVTSVFQESLAATVERLTFPSGEGGRRKAEAEESSLSYGLWSQRKRQKVKNVPTLKVTKVEKVMKVVKFMYQFDLLMETNRVNEADQKSYLLESVHPDVVHCLLVKGVEVSSPGEMMALVKETVLGRFWQKRLLDEWQSMVMLDSESVFQFQQRVHMIMFTLGRRLERVNEHQVILFAKIRPKLPVILREMLEGEQILTNFGMSWSEFWLRLEEIESLMAYQDRLLLYKNFGGGKLPSSDLKGPKGKERSGTSRKGAGESGAAAGDLASSSSSGKKRGAKFCMRCGDCSHGTEDCKHPKASKISLVDGKLPRICFKCFETGHSKKFCPGEGKTKGASGGGSGGSSSKGLLGQSGSVGQFRFPIFAGPRKGGFRSFSWTKSLEGEKSSRISRKGNLGEFFQLLTGRRIWQKARRKRNLLLWSQANPLRLISPR